MNSFSQTLLTNWHIMRWFRLAIGLYAAYEGIINHDTMLGVFGAFFLIQAATNTGCCGTRACATPAYRKSGSQEKDFEYEEIKSGEE